MPECTYAIIFKHLSTKEPAPYSKKRQIKRYILTILPTKGSLGMTRCVCIADSTEPPTGDALYWLRERS